MQRRIALLAILLAALPAANAALQNFSLTYMDAPNNRVQPGVDQPTGVTFTIDEPELTSTDASLDLRNLQSPPNNAYSDVNVDLASCETSGATFTCTLTHQGIYNDGTNLLINHDNDTTATFNITVTTVNGDKTLTATQTITTDATPPKPTYVGPTKCQGQTQCIIGPVPTNITASFQDGTGPFQQQDVIAINEHSDGDQIIRFADTNECTGSICQTTETTQCQNGETTTFTLNTASNPYPPTQDDAGNTIENNTETQATCDAEAPSIESVNVSGSTQNVPTVENGGTIKATLNDNLDQPLTLEAQTANAETSSTCNPSQQTYECSVEAPSVENQGQRTITLRATDKAGNTATRTIDVQYRNVTDQQSNVWTSTTTTSLTEKVNKDILSAKPEAYAKTEFEGDADATLRDLNVQQCQASPKNSVSNVELDYVDESTNTAYFSYQLTSPGFNQTADASTFQATCNVSAISTDATTAYLGGEPETVTATIPLTDGTRLSRSLQNEIQSTRQDIKDYNDGLNKLQRGIEMGQNVCRLGGVLEGVFGGVSSMGGTVSQVPIVGDAIGEGVKGAEKGARTTFQQAWNKYASPLCQILSCRTEPQQEAIDALNTLNQDLIGGSFGENSNVVDSLESFSSGDSGNTYTPFNSYLGTAASMCIPAALKHYKTIQATECSYLQCLTQGVQKVGFSPSQCRAQRSQAQCTYVTQNLMNSLPIYNFLSSSLDKIASIINDPVSLIGTAGTALFCQPGMPARSYFPCEIGSTAQSAQKIIDQVTNIKSAYDAYNALQQGPSKLCEKTMERTSIDSRFYRRQTANQASLNPDDYKPNSEISEIGDNPPASGENWVRLESLPTYVWKFNKDEQEFTSHSLATGNRETFSTEEIANMNPDSDQASDLQRQAAGVIREYQQEDIVDFQTEGIPTSNILVQDGQVTFFRSEDGLRFKSYVGSGDEGSRVDSFAAGYIEGRVTAGESVTLVGKVPPSILGGTYGEKTVRRTSDGKYKVGNQPPKALSELEGAAKEVAEDMEDEWDQVETANNKLFQARFNQRPGPDVTLQEAANISDELSSASQEKLGEASAIKSVAKKFKPGMSKVKDLPEIGGQPAEEYLASRLGVDPSTVAEWGPEKLQEELKKRNEGLSDTLMSATYNVTPTQAAFWNAGQLGQGILRARSLGFNWKNEWGTSQFGEAMQKIASVPDTFANPHKFMCSRQGTGFGKDYQGDVSVNTEGRNRSIGAIVSASKNEFTTPDGSTNTTYVIGYKVQTDTSGLGFSVELRQPGIKDITSSIAGTDTIQVSGSGQSYSAQGNQADTSIRLQEDYSKVCLVFNQNPQGYFDYTSFDGNKLCQEIRQ